MQNQFVFRHTCSPSAVLLKLTFMTLVCLGPKVAGAGTVIVHTDPGTTGGATWVDSSGGTHYVNIKDGGATELKNGGAKDGIVAIYIGTDAEERIVKKVETSKITNGKRSWTVIDVSQGGETLGSLEPFQFPTFDASTPIIVSIDVKALLSLSGSSTFVTGQSYEITNGTITGLSALTFKNATGVVFNPESTAFVDTTSLPAYSGSVSVFSLDKVQPLPEPESYATLLAGLGLIGYVARRRSK